MYLAGLQASPLPCIKSYNHIHDKLTCNYVHIQYLYYTVKLYLVVVVTYTKRLRQRHPSSRLYTARVKPSLA